VQDEVKPVLALSHEDDQLQAVARLQAEHSACNWLCSALLFVARCMILLALGPDGIVCTHMVSHNHSRPDAFNLP
jgi:citrate lyase beta subunit